MKNIFLILFFPFLIFTSDFFFLSYPSNVEGAEGAIVNPASIVELEGFNFFSALNFSYENSEYKKISSKEIEKLKGTIAGSYNISEDIAIGFAYFPLFSRNSNFKPDVPFRFNLRKFEYNLRELKGSIAIRVLNNLNLGFSIRQIKSNFSISKSEETPLIDGRRYEVLGFYNGKNDGISFEISWLLNIKENKFGFSFKPKRKINFGFNDFSVDFKPVGEIPNEILKKINTYYPSGGVKTSIYVPGEISISMTRGFKNLEASFCVQLLDWSSIEEITLDYKNETVDPSTGMEVLKDQKINLKLKDSINFKTLINYKFENDIKVFAEVALKSKERKKPVCAGFENGDGLEITFGGSYPMEFYELKGKFFGYYSFSFYKKNNDFYYTREVLGGGLSFSF